MKKLMLVLVLFWPLATLADLDTGLAAYARGDYASALREFTPLATAGNADAQYSLGVMHARGEGVSRDETAAVTWFRGAAEQGHALAQYNLGVMYDNGIHVPKDLQEAMQWFRRAAEQGNAPAQFNLGVMYDAGEGVAADVGEAVKWFRLAAEQGFARAQYNLGNVYRKGRGVPKDEREAVKWFRRAAEQGFAEGQNNLGFMYAHGLGVNRDDVRAYAWFAHAASQGHPSGRTNRDYLRSRMTAEQIAKAEKLGRALLAQRQADGVASLADARRYLTRRRVSYRSGPGVEHERLGVFGVGVALQVEGIDGDWLRVRLQNGRSAYVHREYARASAAATVAAEATEATAAAEVGEGANLPDHTTIARVNVRAGPGLRHAPIAWLAAGAAVDVLDASKAWLRIRLEDSRIGYVAADYVVPGAANPPPAMPPIADLVQE